MALPREVHEASEINGLEKGLGDEHVIELQGISGASPKPLAPDLWVLAEQTAKCPLAAPRKSADAFSAPGAWRRSPGFEVGPWHPLESAFPELHCGRATTAGG